MISASFIASSGDYQPFKLHGTEWTWMFFAAACGLVAIGTGFYLVKQMLANDQGTPKMIEIAKAVQEGAQAYLARQFRAIGIIVIPLAILVFLTATKVTAPTATGGTRVALPYWEAGLFRTLAFLAGASLSGLAGFIGMSTAVRGNVRTAAAARDGKLNTALRVAFRTGAITGMFVVGFGLVGATVIVMLAQNTATDILIGFGFGCSLLALFMRVGGGIFTKAADVGADLVGKVEAGIPEDDPRNAATIADNVGDNVGDCAGMAADLFESYSVVLVASLILANTAFSRAAGGHQIHQNPEVGLVFSLTVPAIGILASIIGVFSVAARDKDRSAMAPINRGFLTSAVLTVIGVFFVAQFFVHDLKVFWAVLTGVILGQVASRITEYYTSTETAPVRDIAEAARTGPATTVLSGISSGLESALPAIIAIVIAIVVAIGLGQGNIQLELYLVSLTGLGLLSTTGMVVSEDTFGPISDNAAGIAEMSGVGRAGVGGPLRRLYPDHRRKRQGRHRHGQRAVHDHGADDHQRGQPQDVHRSVDRRLDRLHLLRPRDPGRRSLRRHRRAGGASPVPRAPGDHGLHRASRIRAGDRYLHHRGTARAGHPGAARHPVSRSGRFRHRRPGPRSLPGRDHPDRAAHGQLPVERRGSLGQRQEIHRGRPRGRQGLGSPYRRSDRRHGR
jgi:K(+)-stimulated pyrophosphate-energized sodium pump